jgi:hypothetical protein
MEGSSAREEGRTLGVRCMKAGLCRGPWQLKWPLELSASSEPRVAKKDKTSNPQFWGPLPVPVCVSENDCFLH